jgi:hypothetical protein
MQYGVNAGVWAAKASGLTKCKYSASDKKKSDLTARRQIGKAFRAGPLFVVPMFAGRITGTGTFSSDFGACDVVPSQFP